MIVETIMLIQPIDYFLVVWFACAGGCTIYVGWDQYRNNPEPTVMKWGFILVTLYMEPLGLLLYVLADKEPRPGDHERFIAPLWKQGVGSTIHCVAGDATGIISGGRDHGDAWSADVARLDRGVPHGRRRGGVEQTVRRLEF
jgi:hypothetical protein